MRAASSMDASETNRLLPLISTISPPVSLFHVAIYRQWLYIAKFYISQTILIIRIPPSHTHLLKSRLLSLGTELVTMLNVRMLFYILLTCLLFTIVGTAVAEPFDAQTICGFVNRGSWDNDTQHTYLQQHNCRPVGEAVPVKNVYRDPDCECTLYRYVSLKYPIIWH